MPELTPIFPPNIDSTMVAAFRSCPRKFFNEFILGLRPEGISIDLHAGACFAHALEVTRKEIFTKGASLEEALKRAFAAYLIQWGEFEIPEFKKTSKTRERIWDAVLDYFATYPPLSDHIQPYQVGGKPTFEFSFAIPLEPAAPVHLDASFSNHDAAAVAKGLWPSHPTTGEPLIYSGRFDMLGEYQGRPIVEDDKTKGTGFYGNWSESWDLRSQFIGYTWACQQMGLDVDSVAVRGIGVLQTKIHHAEAIKTYSDFLRAQWLEQLRRDLWRMVTAWKENYWDYNMADACTNYSNCMFMQACQSPDPEPWLRTFTVRRWNPLALDPAKEPQT